MATGNGIPRYRPWQGPVLLQQGFRPFFLAAGLWAPAALVLWLAMLQGRLVLPSAFAPATWHAHEMLFGFAGATVAGFLLTAVPNWTGRMPLQGMPLAGLAALWAAGRVAVATSGIIGALPSAVLDLAFPLALLAAVLREVVAGRNWRNLPVCLALAALLAANVLTHLEAIGVAQTAALGLRLGTAVLIVLITLVGGRIVPSFTSNWLRKRGETQLPQPFGRFDRVTLGVSVAALLAWAISPDGRLAAVALLAAGLANLVRLARWRGHRTRGEPLVWVLHLGYAWVAAGLILTGLGTLWPEALPGTAGLHALTAGAIGTMTLAVMTRAILGHTGRPLTAGPGTALIYACVSLGAVLRVASTSAEPLVLSLSGTLWAAAFVLFAAIYGPLLVRSSAGERQALSAARGPSRLRLLSGLRKWRHGARDSLGAQRPSSHQKVSGR